MATTTIRIEDELKSRVAVAAEIAGKTPHAFILDAISATVEQVELDAQFHAIAERRWANIVATGRSIVMGCGQGPSGGPGAWGLSRRPAARKRVFDARKPCRESGNRAGGL
ncbi:MAG: DUF1778 domain-containing protein [Burkholderiaceae bacterium]